MIIRFVVQNVYSFFESKEFNMLPRPKIRTPEGHKYALNGFELLKLSAIYGANGAGKSNLVKSLNLFQKLVTGNISAHKIFEARFKFDRSKPTKQVLAVEFVQENIPFYYAIAVQDGEIATEELYRSGMGKSEDILLFERKTIENGQLKLTFFDAFEKDVKGQVLKSILIEEFLDVSKPVFQWVAKRDNPLLKDIKTAYQWFEHSLQIITPESKPAALVQKIDTDSVFKKYAEDTMCAFHLGISKIGVEKVEIEKKEIEEMLGTGNDEFLSELRDRFSDEKEKILAFRHKGEEVLLVKEPSGLVGKRLKITQSDDAGDEESFDVGELSDGTIRLLDFLPAFRDVCLTAKVYVVDEIERSMHPSMAKELVSKFSHDVQTKGQLIFTTHESNLLDQSIFRQDEIWFAEKKPSGATDLYSLSDFKEHNTIDIRKGYLNGRYGAVPFLANLHDINWHVYDSN